MCEDFLKDNIQKKLVVNTNTAYPLVTATRILKYQLKGYSIDVFELIKLTLTINKLNINSYKKLEEQLGRNVWRKYFKINKRG